MAVSDKIFAALALSQKGASTTSKAGVQTFDYEGVSFAALTQASKASLKLGAPQHAALLTFCAQAVEPEQSDGWTQVDLKRIELTLLADYIGAAYRVVAPKARLVF